MAAAVAVCSCILVGLLFKSHSCAVSRLNSARRLNGCLLQGSAAVLRQRIRDNGDQRSRREKARQKVQPLPPRPLLLRSPPIGTTPLYQKETKENRISAFFSRRTLYRPQERKGERKAEALCLSFPLSFLPLRRLALCRFYGELKASPLTLSS